MRIINKMKPISTLHHWSSCLAADGLGKSMLTEYVISVPSRTKRTNKEPKVPAISVGLISRTMWGVPRAKNKKSTIKRGNERIVAHAQPLNKSANNKEWVIANQAQQNSNRHSSSQQENQIPSANSNYAATSDAADNATSWR